MKQTRIVASSKPVTTVVVSGKPLHYFHSDALGKCRAILISPDENLPRAAVKTEALYQELDGLLEHLRSIPLKDEFEYQDTLMRIRVVRETIFAIESE